MPVRRLSRLVRRENRVYANAKWGERLIAPRHSARRSGVKTKRVSATVFKAIQALEQRAAVLKVLGDQMAAALTAVDSHLRGEDLAEGTPDIDGMVDFEEVDVRINARTVRAVREALGVWREASA